jgi:hypothetical protein
MIVSEWGYPYSDLPIQMADLVGFTKFLTVYRGIYLESNEYHRGLISLSAASFGHCLALAERTAKVLEPERSIFMQGLLDPQLARRTDEVDSKLMFWGTKETLLSRLGGPDKAIEELTFRACSSGQLVRTRARELLSLYFGIESSVLPCIPCE